MQILSIILNILLIRNLSLGDLGQLTIAKVYFQFMDFMHLGSRFTMDRYVPASNDKEGREITLFTMIISFVASLVFMIIVFFFVNNNFIILIFMISGFIFAQGTIYKAFFRAKEKTKEMIQVVLMNMFFPLAVQITAILFFNFKIYLISFIVSYTIGFILLIYYFKLIRVMPYLVFISKAKSFYRATGLLFATSIVIFLSFSIDKILLERYRGSEVLGEYSIILFIFATLMVIPGTLAELVFPKIIKKVTQTSKLIHWKEMSFIFFPTLLAVIVANLFMNFFIIKFTNYAYLLPYLHLISWAVLPYSFTSIMYYTFNALDQRKTILKINLIVLMVYIVYLSFLLDSNSENILRYFVWGRIVYGIILIALYMIFLKKHHMLLIRR